MRIEDGWFSWGGGEDLKDDDEGLNDNDKDNDYMNVKASERQPINSNSNIKNNQNSNQNQNTNPNPNNTQPTLTPFLKDINLTFHPSTFTLLIGPIASGKSSLLLSILSQLTPLKIPKNKKNPIKFKGKIAYISQNPFLLNSTIQQNILFFSPYIPQKYKKTLKICKLLPDLSNLPGYDQTEIGERGINL